MKCIEKYIEPVAGKITDWPMHKEGEDVYNGAFQYTTSRERSWIHNDGFNNWAAVCYLTPNAPVTYNLILLSCAAINATNVS